MTDFIFGLCLGIVIIRLIGNYAGYDAQVLSIPGAVAGAVMVFLAVRELIRVRRRP